jgi:hypothetical protein
MDRVISQPRSIYQHDGTRQIFYVRRQTGAQRTPDDTVNRILREQRESIRFAVGPALTVNEAHHEPKAAGLVFNCLSKRWEKRIREIRQHQADGACAAGTHGLCLAIGPVAQLFRDAQNFLPKFISHIGTIVQGIGNRCDGYPYARSNVLYRWHGIAFAACRGKIAQLGIKNRMTADCWGNIGGAGRLPPASLRICPNEPALFFVRHYWRFLTSRRALNLTHATLFISGKRP